MRRKIRLENLLKEVKHFIDIRFTDRNLCIKNGYNINDGINYLRIELAKDYLRSYHSNISGIAKMCGFSSRSYFYHVFKKIEGITPTQYRTKIDNTII